MPPKAILYAFIWHSSLTEEDSEAGWLINSEYKNQAWPSWRDTTRDGGQTLSGEKRNKEGDRKVRIDRRKTETERGQLADLTHIYKYKYQACGCKTKQESHTFGMCLFECGCVRALSCVFSFFCVCVFACIIICTVCVLSVRIRDSLGQ